MCWLMMVIGVLGVAAIFYSERRLRKSTRNLDLAIQKYEQMLTIGETVKEVVERK